MAGYYNYEMSNNAVSAYNYGEMPMSKWDKASILAEIERIIEEEKISVLDMGTVEKLTKTELADTFLKWSSWHHTSSYYRKTEFYRIEVGDIDTAEVLSIIANRQPKGKKPAPVAVPITYADISYGVWEGSRKYPKLERYTAKAVVRGNWAYTLDGKKKKIDGQYFTILKSYDHIPQTFDTDAVAKINARFK